MTQLSSLGSSLGGVIGFGVGVSFVSASLASCHHPVLAPHTIQEREECLNRALGTAFVISFAGMTVGAHLGYLAGQKVEAVWERINDSFV